MKNNEDRKESSIHYHVTLPKYLLVSAPPMVNKPLFDDLPIQTENNG